MKIVSLNTWGGKISSPLINFISDKSKDTDIFCFQEVFNNAVSTRPHLADKDIALYPKIVSLLPTFTGYFNEIQSNEEGLAIFVSNEIKVLKQSHIFVHRWLNAMKNHDVRLFGRIVQYITIPKDNTSLTILNFHGLWNGLGKDDTDDRINQSKNILDLIKSIKGEIVLCGDFNLLPETKSIRMFEEYGLKNLIKEFNVSPTRSSLYDKPLPFADYIFVSQGIKVKNFKVLTVEVSDHLPLELEFEI